MIFNMVSSGYGGGGTTLPTFDYTGTSEFIDDGNGNWRLYLKTSGDLRFSDLGNARRGIDVFLCGGGGSGGSGWYMSNTAGGGGGGGYIERAYEVKIAAKTVYPIVIGEGGARPGVEANGNDGQDTTAFGHTAAGGKGGLGNGRTGGAGFCAGGLGGVGTGTRNGGAGGDSIDNAWGGDVYYGAGGGGGGSRQAGNNGSSTGGAGGKSGGGKGGNGGNVGATSGDAGVANTGGGGGGNGTLNDNTWQGATYGGAGGSGVVIIRNAR